MRPGVSPAQDAARPRAANHNDLPFLRCANPAVITAKGTRLTLVLNGVKTVDVDDAKLASGPIALQWGRGTIKFRKVEVRAI